MQDFLQLVTDLILQGYLGLFIACFIINMIPFLSPSNMVLAGVAALLLPSMSWIAIGIIVAIAATLAKLFHYFVIRGSRVVMSDKRLAALDSERERVDKWGALALFIAAASPVPDDPLIVYVGLTKYSVSKFVGFYFVGKVAVTLAGALIGSTVSNYFESMPIVLASIALTALITGILFKRKTEGEESDMLQDLLEEEIFDSDDDDAGAEVADDDDDGSEVPHNS
ncbi:MAG: VTT domain-containing protein [Candidatus Thorarchaeota archaeon]|nr:VTT domain-containing protein [Candidatus Thorarchaeota archaeon]